MFPSAVITSLLVLAVLTALGLATWHPKVTLVGADLIGGLILGAGITLTGACPGTVMAQLGAAYKDAWLTFIGGLLGALTFSYLEPTLKPVLLAGGPGKLTLGGVLGLPFGWLTLGIAALLAVGVYVLESWRPWQEFGEQADGLGEKTMKKP